MKYSDAKMSMLEQAKIPKQSLFNPIPAGGGGAILNPPPPVFFCDIHLLNLYVTNFFFMLP